MALTLDFPSQLMLFATTGVFLVESDEAIWMLDGAATAAGGLGSTRGLLATALTLTLEYFLN